MPSRGRDLTFSLLSDADRFDLGKPASELEDLGDAAADTGKALDRLERDAAAVDLERNLERPANDAGRAVEDLGDDVRRLDLEGTLGDEAKRTARKVDDAFDAIAKSSQSSARKVDDDTDTMRRSVGEVGDEARDTAREMAASFDGSSESVLDAFQELGANAGEAFGPIGAAAGIAATIGVGLIRAEAEKLKTLTSELVQEMIDAGGKLNEQAIQSRIQTMATEDPANFTKYNDRVRELEEYGITLRDVTRARAGDIDSLEKIRTAFGQQEAAARKAAKGSAVAQRGPITALGDLRQELNLTTKATKLAEEAVATATTAAAGEVKSSSKSGQAAWDDLRANLGRPIRARVVADAPSASELARVRSGIMRGIGTIPVALRVSGQNIYTNNANNDRYRW